MQKAKLTYTGIRVKDLEESVGFYSKVLGMKETGRSKIDASKGECVALSSEDGGPVIELNYYEKGSRFDTDYSTGESLDHIAFQVADLDKFVAESNCKVVLEMSSGSSRWLYIQDPNGIWLELFS